MCMYIKRFCINTADEECWEEQHWKKAQDLLILWAVSQNSPFVQMYFLLN